MDRFDELREHIDVAGGRELEIGPLASPVVPRKMGEVYYVDHLPTDELIAKFTGDPDVDETLIVSTDFVWGSNTLAEAVGSSAPFDYVVASHVLEHVPDLIGWLNEVSAVLRPGGRLVWRCRIGDTPLISAVERLMSRRLLRHRCYISADRPFAPPSTISIGTSRSIPVPSGQALPGHDDPPPDAETAIAFATKSATTGAYLDTHCWVFSDAKFVELMATLMQMDLVTLFFVAFRPTQPGDFEFFVTLERPPDGLTTEQRRALCLGSVPDVSSEISAPNGGALATAASSGHAYVLSDREIALIDAKRKAMDRMRAAKQRLRRR